MRNKTKMVIAWSQGGKPTHFVWNRRIEIAIEDNFCLPGKFEKKEKRKLRNWFRIR